jgi:hypothetical protein
MWSAIYAALRPCSSPSRAIETWTPNLACRPRLLRVFKGKRTMQAGMTNLIDQHSNAYRSSSLADVAEKRADQLVRTREPQLGLPVFHASQFVNESERSPTVAPEIRQSLAALLMNIDASRRWLSADPPNIRQARAALERMTGNATALTKLISTSGPDDNA